MSSNKAIEYIEFQLHEFLNELHHTAPIYEPPKFTPMPSPYFNKDNDAYDLLLRINSYINSLPSYIRSYARILFAKKRLAVNLLSLCTKEHELMWKMVCSAEDMQPLTF